MKILITGASGFIGSHLVEEALRRGFEVWAGVRRTSSRRYLQHPQIHFAELDLCNEENLRAQLAAFRGEIGRWGLIIHAAGVTKCKDTKEFMEGNYEATRRFADALRDLDMVPTQFFFLSSLSVLGPLHEKDGAPLRADEQPCPNTAYGKSKRAAEEYLQSLPNFPLVIFRPTGVYGPRETDYYLMAKSIQQHIDFAVGYQPQMLTFIYIKDLTQAIFRAVERNIQTGCYLLSDGDAYRSRTYATFLQEALGVRGVLHITCPLRLLKFLCGLFELVAKSLGKSSTLNRDKYQIMKQRNWQCDLTPAIEELGYNPRYPLERGVRETIAWYKQEKWL